MWDKAGDTQDLTSNVFVGALQAWHHPAPQNCKNRMSSRITQGFFHLFIDFSSSRTVWSGRQFGESSCDLIELCFRGLGNQGQLGATRAQLNRVMACAPPLTHDLVYLSHTLMCSGYLWALMVPQQSSAVFQWLPELKQESPLFSRTRSEGFPFYTLGVCGWRCFRWTPLWCPRASATVCNRLRAAVIAESCRAYGKSCTFLEVSSVTQFHFAWQAWHFATCGCGTVVAESCRGCGKSCRRR